MGVVNKPLGVVNKPFNQVLEVIDLAKVIGLSVFIEQKQSSSRFEENDVGTAQKEGVAAGNCLKKTNAGNRKRRNVNSPTGNDEKRKRDGSLTDSKGVDSNIVQMRRKQETRPDMSHII